MMLVIRSVRFAGTVMAEAEPSLHCVPHVVMVIAARLTILRVNAVQGRRTS